LHKLEETIKQRQHFDLALQNLEELKRKNDEAEVIYKNSIRRESEMKRIIADLDREYSNTNEEIVKNWPTCLQL